jgi:hypothetical protein
MAIVESDTESIATGLKGGGKIQAVGISPNAYAACSNAPARPSNFDWPAEAHTSWPSRTKVQFALRSFISQGHAMVDEECTLYPGACLFVPPRFPHWSE